MDSVNLASEGTEATNRIKALAGVAERIGCTLMQVRNVKNFSISVFVTTWKLDYQEHIKVAITVNIFYLLLLQHKGSCSLTENDTSRQHLNLTYSCFQLSLAWCIRNQTSQIIIISATSSEHLIETLNSLAVTI
jgi:hypothetical protein